MGEKKIEEKIREMENRLEKKRGENKMYGNKKDNSNRKK